VAPHRWYLLGNEVSRIALLWKTLPTPGLADLQIPHAYDYLRYPWIRNCDIFACCGVSLQLIWRCLCSNIEEDFHSAVKRNHWRVCNVHSHPDCQFVTSDDNHSDNDLWPLPSPKVTLTYILYIMLKIGRRMISAFNIVTCGFA